MYSKQHIIFLLDEIKRMGEFHPLMNSIGSLLHSSNNKVDAGLSLYKTLYECGYQVNREISRLDDVFGCNGFHRAYLLNSTNISNLIGKIQRLNAVNSPLVVIERNIVKGRVFLLFSYSDERKSFYSPHAIIFLISSLIKEIFFDGGKTEFEVGLRGNVIDESSFFNFDKVIDNAGHDFLSYPESYEHLSNKSFNVHLEGFFNEQMKIRYERTRTLGDLMDYEPNKNRSLLGVINSELNTSFLLQKGLPTIDNIALHVNLSRSSLHRKLADINCSYKNIIDDFRKEKAESLIINNEYGIGDVSDMLGYKNTSSFDRAFKRWFNVTPVEYKKRK